MEKCPKCGANPGHLCKDEDDMPRSPGRRSSSIASSPNHKERVYVAIKKHGYPMPSVR